MSDVAIHCAHDAAVPLADLKPHPANPNTHPESQIALLAKIIQEQGWRNPIVVSNRSGFITKGHGRLAAAKLAGLDVAPVDYQDYSSEKQELADMIADNRIAELAELDRSMMRELVEQLDDGAFDMDLTGFDHDALEELMTAAPPESDIDAEPQIDKAEELRKKWGVERGQIWELGDHRLMCGDARSTDVPKLINGDSVGLYLTDPPYNIGFEAQRNGSKYPDALTSKEYLELLQRSFKASPCKRAIVTCGKWNLKLWLENFEVTEIAVWIASNKMSGGSVSNLSLFEPIIFIGDFDRTSRPTDVFDFSAGFQKDADAHPCPKPIQFWTDIVRHYGAKVVYDSFTGSGTTIIACEQLGRKCRAMEIDPGYVAVSIQRWADATGKTPKLLTSFPNKGKE